MKNNMDKTVNYKYILENYRFRLPKIGTKDEYTTSFEDFDITVSFKKEEINPIIANKLIKCLKEINHIEFINKNAKKEEK